MEKARICELDSDFEGYVTVLPDHLCARYDKRIQKC
jgi:hypothetical protein